ncbi:MAG: kinase [Halobacteriales archaeon SW_9_67_25]|nr:MAG: kinase [Halobacteriales archaeon SW_9_67_25]
MESSAGTDPADVASLVVVCGLPGVGKSRVARAIGDCLPATVYRTDEVRADLFADPTYERAETERVYAELLEGALATVDAGGRAVLDGTYREERFRAAVVEAADDRGLDPLFLNVECAPEVARERIAARTDDASDASVADYERIREAFEGLSRPHETVDNSGDWEQTRKQVCATLGVE